MMIKNVFKERMAPILTRAAVSVAVSLLLSLPVAGQPSAVNKWIRETAIPLRTAEPESGLEDMEPLARLIGDARLVTVGEATHGTREFFQLKHRMLEFLVRRMGFSVFAIEASAPDAVAVNNYVVHGRGDPAQAVAGMLFWTWNTEEVLAMVKWMRAYNVDARNIRKLEFHGFDMQNPRASSAILDRYLRRVDGEAAKAGLFKQERFLDQRREAYVKRSSLAEWQWARRQVELIRQGQHLSLPRVRMGGFRDQAMAANIQWILDHQPAGTKMMVWAHNGHVSTEEPYATRSHGQMGAHLRKIYGDQMRVFGFAFDRGRFQAVLHRVGLVEHTTGPARRGSFDAALAAAGIPLFVLDLRPATGAVRKWLETPQQHHSIGAIYSAALDDKFWPSIRPLRSYDAVIFVARTTAAKGRPRISSAGKQSEN